MPTLICPVCTVTPMQTEETRSLRVWWIPQVPMRPFYVPVSNLAEARLLIDALADYDLFQLKHHIKPDYSNIGGLQVRDEGEWVDWDDEEGANIEDGKYARKHA